MVGQPDAGEAPQYRLKRDLGFEVGQRRADADVGAETERQMVALVARDVEPIRLGELRRIAIGSAKQRDDELTPGESAAVHLYVREQAPAGRLQQAIVAQQFLE